MNKILIIGVFILSFEMLPAQSFNRPESIVYDAAHKRYLISNYGNGTDGSILSYDPAEEVYSYFNTTQSVGPKGMVLFNNCLYVAENGFINGFNLETGQRVFNKQVGSFWINDLTVDEAGNLYTGETNTGKIYKVNTQNGQVEEWITGGLENLNGLLVDPIKNRLLVVFYKNYSPILQIDLETKEITTLVETNFHNCDGITTDNCGQFYISSQGAKLVFKYNADFTGSPVVVLENLSTPADIYYNRDLEILCIPEMDSNRIKFVEYFNTCQRVLLIAPADLELAASFMNLKFDWEPVPKVDYYRFELAEDAEFRKLITVDGTGEPEFVVESLEPMTTYFWRVCAYKGNLHTEYSETRSFRTESSSGLPEQLTSQEYRLFPNPTNGTVRLSWIGKVPDRFLVFNAIGQEMLEFKNFEPNQSNGQLIQLGDLPIGLYHCMITIEDRNAWSERLVVIW